MNRDTTFLRLNHNFVNHARFVELSNDALVLHLAGLSHASEHLTDGRLSKAPIERIKWATRFVARGDDLDAAIAELTDAGVWLDRDDHFEIDGYTDHNRSRAEVDELREANRRRQAEWRARQKGKSSSGPNPADADTDTDTPPLRNASVTHDLTRYGDDAEPATTGDAIAAVAELRKRIS